MSFETMRLQSPRFLAFVWNSLMSKQGYLKAGMTSLMCDVEVAFSKMSTETAGEMSSIFARACYIFGMVERERDAAVE